MVAEMSPPWGHRQRPGRGRRTGDSVPHRSPLAALGGRQPKRLPSGFPVGLPRDEPARHHCQLPCRDPLAMPRPDAANQPSVRPNEPIGHPVSEPKNASRRARASRNSSAGANRSGLRILERGRHLNRSLIPPQRYPLRSAAHYRCPGPRPGAINEKAIRLRRPRCGRTKVSLGIKTAGERPGQWRGSGRWTSDARRYFFSRCDSRGNTRPRWERRGMVCGPVHQVRGRESVESASTRSVGGGGRRREWRLGGFPRSG